MQLTDNQRRFYDWLESNAPYLMGLWDWGNKEVLFEGVDAYLGKASHGEALMCRFAVAVWLGRNAYNFDLISAAGVLGEKNRAAIATWFKEPFWP